MQEYNSILRFSTRVNDYDLYRPGYPTELVDFLIDQKIIFSGCQVADIGSGTGISSEIFLNTGCQVYSAEPNPEMQQKAAVRLSKYPGFNPIMGTAENTGLADNSIDIIIAAQAFHWFNNKETSIEFKRILRPNGFVCLIWNDRDHYASEFMKAYEDLIKRFSIDYETVNHQNLSDKDFTRFFGGGFQKKSFLNTQSMDLQGFKGRITSCSYMPDSSHPSFESMNETMENIFTGLNKKNKVAIIYQTKLYFGQIN